MPLTTVTYFTYSEIAQTERTTLNEFRTELAKFSRTEVVYSCGLLNAILCNWQGKSDRKTHDLLVRDSLPPRIANFVIARFHDSDRPRGLYHRQQLLFVCKEATQVCGDSGRNPLALPYWGGLGIVLMMANDLLPKRITHPKTNVTEQMLSVMSEMIPVAEASGFYRPINKIIRSYLLLNRFLPETTLNVAETFRKCRGRVHQQVRGTMLRCADALLRFHI